MNAQTAASFINSNYIRAVSLARRRRQGLVDGRRVLDDPRYVGRAVAADHTSARDRIERLELRYHDAGLAATGSWLLVPDVTDEPRAVVRIFDMRNPAVPVETAALELGRLGRVDIAQRFGDSDRRRLAVVQCDC